MLFHGGFQHLERSKLKRSSSGANKKKNADDPPGLRRCHEDETTVQINDSREIDGKGDHQAPRNHNLHFILTHSCLSNQNPHSLTIEHSLGLSTKIELETTPKKTG